jgi:hypothetical protein
VISKQCIVATMEKVIEVVEYVADVALGFIIPACGGLGVNVILPNMSG